MLFKKKLFLLFSLLIIFIGSIPRAIEVFSGNYLFGFDQGLFYEAVRSIVVERHLTLIGAEVGGIGGFFQGPGWYYLLTIPFLLFRGDPYGGMILMFFLGIIASALSIFLFQKDLGSKEAILTGTFISFSPGIISQSRFIWPPFVITPLCIVLLFCVLQAYRNKKYFIPLSFVVIGLMSHFEIATAGTLLFSTLITYLIIRPKNFFSLKIIMLSILGFISVNITLIIFDIRHNFLSSKGVLTYLFHGSSVKSAYNLKNHFDMFKDSLYSISQNWEFGALLIGISLYAMLLLLKDKKIDTPTKNFLKFTLISIFMLFIVTLPIRSTLWSWWFLDIPVYLSFLFGICLSYLYSLKGFRYITLGVLFFFVLLFIQKTLLWYKNDYKDFGGTAKIKGKTEAIDLIFKDAQKKDFGLFVFSPPVYTYPYDYILHWYAKDKYGYVPPAEKRKTFYLLIEPDPEKPWSYKGWLETVIKNGKPEKNLKSSGGFIIQKRTI